MFKACANLWETEEINSGPWSDWMEARRPNCGMISVTKIDVTVEALFLVMGKASTHPMKVSTNTRSYLTLFLGGTW
jgi:hypothetical protein